VSGSIACDPTLRRAVRAAELLLGQWRGPAVPPPPRARVAMQAVISGPSLRWSKLVPGAATALARARPLSASIALSPIVPAAMAIRPLLPVRVALATTAALPLRMVQPVAARALPRAAGAPAMVEKLAPKAPAMARTLRPRASVLHTAAGAALSATLVAATPTDLLSKIGVAPGLGLPGRADAACAPLRTDLRAAAPVKTPAASLPPGARSAIGPRGADVAEMVVDGTRLDRWLADHLAREAGRPQAGGTGFDPRLTPAWPGTLQGPAGWGG
jgi:hypothetical protein